MEGNAKFSHEVSTKEDVIPSYPKAQASQKSVGKFRTSAIDHMWEVSKKTKKQTKQKTKKNLNTGQYRVLFFFWGTILCIAQTVRMLLINRKISLQADTEEKRLVF